MAVGPGSGKAEDAHRAQGRRPGWTPVVLLGGDVLCFLVFAALGRNQHNEAPGVLNVVETAWPFVAGWIVVAPLRGVLAIEPGRPAVAARGVLLAWPLAWPIALVLRAGLQHRDIPLSFDIVALLVNGAFLLGWRVAFDSMLGRLHADGRP